MSDSSPNFETDGRPPPADAVEQARAHQPNLVLLDVALPDYDGFRVCQQLKSDAETAHIQDCRLA